MYFICVFLFNTLNDINLVLYRFFLCLFLFFSFFYWTLLNITYSLIPGHKRGLLSDLIPNLNDPPILTILEKALKTLNINIFLKVRQFILHINIFFFYKLWGALNCKYFFFIKSTPELKAVPCFWDRMQTEYYIRWTWHQGNRQIAGGWVPLFRKARTLSSLLFLVLYCYFF